MYIGKVETMEELCIKSMIKNCLDIWDKFSTNEGLMDKLNTVIEGLTDRELFDYLYQYFRKEKLDKLFHFVTNKEKTVKRITNYTLDTLYCLEYLRRDKIILFDNYFWRMGISVIDNYISYKSPIYTLESLKIIFSLFEKLKCDECGKILNENSKYELHSFNHFNYGWIDNRCSICDEKVNPCELSVHGGKKCTSNYLIFGEKCICIEQKCLKCK